MKDIIDLVLRIIAWGLIAFIASLILLKGIGVIHSPSFEVFTAGWLVALSVEIIRVERSLSRIESKLEMLWKDFETRKEL